jgi:hypothetical protein
MIRPEPKHAIGMTHCLVWGGRAAGRIWSQTGLAESIRRTSLRPVADEQR